MLIFPVVSKTVAAGALNVPDPYLFIAASQVSGRPDGTYTINHTSKLIEYFNNVCYI